MFIQTMEARQFNPGMYGNPDTYYFYEVVKLGEEKTTVKMVYPEVQKDQEFEIPTKELEICICRICHHLFSGWVGVDKAFCIECRD